MSIENREFTPKLIAFSPVEVSTVEDVQGIVGIDLHSFVYGERAYISVVNPEINDFIDKSHDILPHLGSESYEYGALLAHRILRDQAFKKMTALPLMSEDFVNAFLEIKELRELQLSSPTEEPIVRDLRFTDKRGHELYSSDEELYRALTQKHKDINDPRAVLMGGILINLALKDKWDIDRYNRMFGW